MGKGNSVTLSAIKSVVIKSDAEFIFYPNPATSVLQIIRLSPAPALLKLTDLSGKTLLQQQVQSKQISLVLPVLSAGVYLLNIDGMVKKLQIR